MQLQQQHQSISKFTYLFVHRHILIIVSICQTTRHNKYTVVYRTAAGDAAADAAAAAAQLPLLLLQFMMLQERCDDDPATLVSTKIS